MTSRKRLTPIERLAREICWANLAMIVIRMNPNCTKAVYWARLPDESQANWIQEAQDFAWLCRRLGAPEIAKILADTDGIGGTG